MTKPLSTKLQELSNTRKPKTIQSLIDVFEGKSFAALFLLLMAVPALPLPTAGITHIFEIIVMFLAVEMVVGRRNIWLPKAWLYKQLPDKFWNATVPRLSKTISKVEHFSKPRLSTMLAMRWFGRVTGIIVFIFALFAFIAPPFSGLDTLPALGIVLIAVALLLEDFIVGTVGVLIGILGIILVLFLGHLALKVL